MANGIYNIKQSVRQDFGQWMSYLEKNSRDVQTCPLNQALDTELYSWELTSAEGLLDGRKYRLSRILNTSPMTGVRFAYQQD